MRRRRFSGQEDLHEMQVMVMERTRVVGPCTNLHPGDIAHRIYSGSRGRNPEDVVPVYVDDEGIAGFGIIWPADRAFDAVTRVGLDEETVTAIVEDLATSSRDDTIADIAVETDVIGDDREMIAVLTALEFARAGTEYVITQASLDTAASDPTEPFGYILRSVTDADAQQLALVHSGAFGSGWSAANYAERMSMPGYDPDNEIVAVDDDGTFMGFTVMWYDEVNRVGYFEPVGVHRDFHRRGVGSALLSEGKARMQRAGMITATVWHASADERAVAFYRSNGFEPINPVTRWARS